MTPERYQQIDQIFQAAIQIKPEQRHTFLDEACGADGALRSEVESLLTSDSGGASFIEGAAFDVAAALLGSDEPELHSGDRIERYEILSLLGSGGMGEVYLAHDEKLNRKIALKLLPSDFASDSKRLRRFEQEARAASALNHPNIITIHEIGEFDGRHFIATEFIDGQTLRQRFQTSRLSVDESIDVAIQICSALSAAHQAGIIHRDIKPENIMLRPDGYVKVLDFGLAKLAQESEAQFGREERTGVDISSGLLMGTVKYMSPEQAHGEQVDARSDIFSLGIVLYEMLSSSAPFVADDALALIQALQKDDPPRIHDLRSELQEVLDRALKKDSAERYQTADEFLTSLKNSQQTPGIRRTSLLKRAAAVLAGVGALIAIIVGLQSAGPSSKSALTAAKRKTVAVLPFKSIGKDPVDDYLRFGIADVVINKLTGLQEIIVRPLASVSKYGATDKDPITAGKELSVDVVLDGQIQRNGDHYRVTVQLWQVADGASLSSYACDETCAQIFELEDAVSERAMNALAIRLTTQEQKYLAKRYTDNQAAYDLYLKGRYYFSKNTPEGFAKSAAYFRQAVDLEPNHAPAYAGLSDAYYMLSWQDSPQAGELMLRAKTAANKALEIDDGLAEAHAAAGGVKLQDWDWTGAKAEIERALALKPNYIRALDLYAGTVILTGQYDEAIEVTQHQLELDPLSITNNCDLAYIYLYARHTDQAISQLQKIIEMDPKLPVAHHFLANAYYQKGTYDKFVEKVIEIRSDPPLNKGDWNARGLSAEQVREAYARGGLHGFLREELESLLARSKKEYVPPKRIAVLYVMLGENDRAMEWLQKTIDEHSQSVMTFKVDPRLARIQSYPPFKEMLRRLGLEPM